METSASPSPWPVVTRPEVTDVLLDRQQRRFLAPFLGRSRTVTEAATELGVKPNSLLYQIRKLLELGLLEIVAVEPRAGRALRRYQAVAARFFVPFESTRAETLERLLLDSAQGHAERFARHFARVLLDTPEGGMGYLVGRHDHGEVDAYFSPDGARVWSLLEPDAPAAGRAWLVLQLDHPDAKAFQAELWALWERYLAKQGSGRYLAHFDLTPLQHE